ncbi:hypothetical protein BKA64DRAFT_647846 [Cadophora sp. MPI-SDFR-AT-0126]|nr:hypothetical protein BKA64DRAFT_647846 [Leotiomycetes sp. MPI-SDFR-AT-0126]
MGKLEEKRLAEVRAQVLAARRAASTQKVAPQSSSTSTASSVWAQKATARYVQERPVVDQQGTTSYATNPAGYTHAHVPGQSTVSSIGISNMSVKERVPILHGAMPLVQGHNDQSMHSQHCIGGLNQRPTDMFHHKSDFEPGVVFSAVTHEHHYRQDRIDRSNANQTETKFGITNSKFRKFVVLSRFEHHVIALPILTHEGRGLSSKRHKDEFISVRDRIAQASAAPAESKHGTLWAETYPEVQYTSAWHRMSDSCCLHITKPYSHNMAHKCTISGRLEDQSFVRLQKLFRNAVLSSAANISQAPRPATHTTPRRPSFAHTKTSVAETGPRQIDAWSSTRSNLSQFSLSAR